MPFLTSLFHHLLNLCFPPRCLSCSLDTTAPSSLCPKCWAALNFIDAPTCSLCGLPLETIGDTVLCGPCLHKRPSYHRCRSVLVYDRASKALILGFKHGDKTENSTLMARWLAQTGHRLLTTSDLIIPVPLHRTRLLKRRYNQAALLAAALSRQSGCPWAGMFLHRHKKTEYQGRGTARQRNVAGAFRCTQPARIAGQRILLIDDVFTTGATVESCSKALLKAGAQQVQVLTVARALPRRYNEWSTL